MWALAVLVTSLSRTLNCGGRTRGKLKVDSRESANRLALAGRTLPDSSEEPPKSTCRVHGKAQGRFNFGDDTESRPSGLYDGSAVEKENSGRTLEGNEAQESIGLWSAATLDMATDSATEKKPWDRGSSFVKRPNGEKARAAVTRYGCSRGESSEGCEARSRGGLRLLVLPRGGACEGA